MIRFPLFGSPGAGSLPGQRGPLSSAREETPTGREGTLVRPQETYWTNHTVHVCLDGVFIKELVEPLP